MKTWIESYLGAESNHRHADFQSATSTSWALLISKLPGRPMPLIAVLCITVHNWFTQNSRKVCEQQIANKNVNTWISTDGAAHHRQHRRPCGDQADTRSPGPAGRCLRSRPITPKPGSAADWIVWGNPLFKSSAAMTPRYGIFRPGVLICTQYCPAFAYRKWTTQVRPRAILSGSLTAVAGAIQSANLCCFWFKFRCKCTSEPYCGSVISHSGTTKYGYQWLYCRVFFDSKWE